MRVFGFDLNVDGEGPPPGGEEPPPGEEEPPPTRKGKSKDESVGDELTRFAELTRSAHFAQELLQAVKDGELALVPVEEAELLGRARAVAFLKEIPGRRS